MSSLFTLLIVGMVIYMLFSKNGGMGGCGGHHDHHEGDPARQNPTKSVNPSDEWKGDIIDLGKDDYQVIASGDTYTGQKNRSSRTVH